MLGTLVQGRVSLDGSANRASQLALHIAITYASQRRQFSAADPTQEVVLLDYQSHLHRLLPKLAATYAGAFARSEEHTSELQSRGHLVCRLLLEKKNR